MNLNAAGQYKLNGQNGEEWTLVNENVGNTMKPKTWYLLPQAYSITLVPKPTVLPTARSGILKVNNYFCSKNILKLLRKLKIYGPRESNFLTIGKEAAKQP